jgi:hypothetical protein
MARRKRHSRPSVLVTFEEPHPSAWADSKDSSLFQLAARLRSPSKNLHAAMTELAQAEQRLSEVQTEGSQRWRRPSWYVAAEAKEEAAGNAIELIYQQIAQTPAHTKAGLAIKLQLVAELYGETLSSATRSTTRTWFPSCCGRFSPIPLVSSRDR